jgi:hypothetical protein
VLIFRGGRAAIAGRIAAGRGRRSCLMAAVTGTQAGNGITDRSRSSLIPHRLNLNCTASHPADDVRLAAPQAERDPDEPRRLGERDQSNPSSRVPRNPSTPIAIAIPATATPRDLCALSGSHDKRDPGRGDDVDTLNPWFHRPVYGMNASGTFGGDMVDHAWHDEPRHRAPVTAGCRSRRTSAAVFNGTGRGGASRAVRRPSASRAGRGVDYHIQRGMAPAGFWRRA